MPIKRSACPTGIDAEPPRLPNMVQPRQYVNCGRRFTSSANAEQQGSCGWIDRLSGTETSAFITRQVSTAEVNLTPTASIRLVASVRRLTIHRVHLSFRKNEPERGTSSERQVWLGGSGSPVWRASDSSKLRSTVRLRKILLTSTALIAARASAVGRSATPGCG